MKKFQFKPALCNYLEIRFLSSGETKSALYGRLAKHEKHYMHVLRSLATELDLEYRNLSTHSLHFLTTNSYRDKGCNAEVFFSLALLACHAIHQNEHRDPLMWLDGGEAARTDLLKEFPKLDGFRITLPERNTMSQILPDISDGPHISHTCSEAELDWIAEQQDLLYQDDAVPIKLYKEWYDMNPTGFFMFYLGGEIIGHLTLLPFREANFLPYKQGLIRETALSGSAIWPPRDRDKINLLYVESYMISPRHARPATQLIRASFLEMGGKVADLGNVVGIYAMDATDHGFNAIRNMGFTKVESLHERRVDGHTLNEATVETIRRKINGLAIGSEALDFIRSMEKMRRDVRGDSAFTPTIRTKVESLISELEACAQSATSSYRRVLSRIIDLNHLLSQYLGKDPQLMIRKKIRAYLDTLPGQ